MKIIRNTPTPARAETRGGRSRYAQAAAIEKSLARYMRLECGHMQTKEDAALFAVFAPLGEFTIYCGKCDDFKKPAPKPKREYPDNPLF